MQCLKTQLSSLWLGAAELAGTIPAAAELGGMARDRRQWLNAGLCSLNTYRPEIRSVSALMYGPRSWEWEMPLAPSARICRIRSSSEERESANNISRSTAPSITPGVGSAPFRLSHVCGTGEAEGHGEVLLHGTALPSSLSSSSRLSPAWLQSLA